VIDDGHHVDPVVDANLDPSDDRAEV